MIGERLEKKNGIPELGDFLWVKRFFSHPEKVKGKEIQKVKKEGGGENKKSQSREKEKGWTKRDKFN